MDFGFTGEVFAFLPQPFLELMADNPFTGDLYVHSLGRVGGAAHHRVEKPRGGNGNILLHCTKGEGTVSFGGDTFRLGVNQFVVVPEGIPYKYNSSGDDPWDLTWVRFVGSKAAFFAKPMNRPQTLPSIHSLREKLTDLFDSMLSLLSHVPSLEKLNYANGLLAHFLSTFLYKELYPDTALPGSAPNSIIRATHFMNENLERNLTIRELAEYVGYSDSYFYRRFVQETGYPPIDYFIRMKINKAAVYLIRTTMSSAQIAARLGFGNPGHFSKTFKKIVGITVTEFRRQGFRL